MNTRKLQIIWKAETATRIANSSEKPIKGYDPKTMSTTFEKVNRLGSMGNFIFVELEDGTEYGYPQDNIQRLKLTD